MPIPHPQPAPPHMRQRAYSFAVEYYGMLSWGHRIVLLALDGVFPDPLAASSRALRRAKLAGPDVLRGDVVTGPMGEGRFVGRHPTAGTPIVAWDAGAYPAMCEAYDEENAARIAAYQRLSDAWALTDAACTARALQIDRAIRWTLLLGTVLPGLAGLAMGEGLSAAVVSAILAGCAVAMIIGGLVTLSAVLLIPTATLMASIAGARAARASRAAISTDDAARSSAGAVLKQIKREVP